MPPCAPPPGLLALYGATVELVVWALLVPIELVRAGLGRSSFAELRERLGRPPTLPAAARPRLVVHAVSAGEVAAAGAFLDAWRPSPGGGAVGSVLLTTGNASGRSAATLLRQRNSVVGAVAFLPWDRPAAVRRWLAALAPEAVVVVETELWPGLFLSCRQLGIPLLVVNGRLYPRDVPRYRLVRRLFRSVLECPDRIAVQDETERERFLSIGAPGSRLVVTGDLKLDALAPAAQPVPRDGGAPLVVAGSTHRGEDRRIVAAVSLLRHEFPGLRLVLAPRHPQRASAVAQIAEAAGLRTQLHSRIRSGSEDADVVVLDRIGFLAPLYGSAEIAIVGGSLVPRGGHSPLEAAAAGCPVVIGPWTEHVSGSVALLDRAGALVRLPSGSAASLVDALRGLLSDPARRHRMGEAARSAVAAARGPSGRAAALVSAALERRGSPLSAPSPGESPGPGRPPHGIDGLG